MTRSTPGTNGPRHRTMLTTARPVVDAVALALLFAAPSGVRPHWTVVCVIWGGLTAVEWQTYTLRVANEIPRIALIVAGVVGVASRLVGDHTFEQMVQHGVLAVCSIWLLRAVLYALVRHLRTSRGWFTERVGVLGTGGDADEFFVTARNHPEFGIEPLFTATSANDGLTIEHSTTIVFADRPDETHAELSDRLWLAASQSGRVLVPVASAAAGTIAARRYEEVWALPFAMVTDGRSERFQRGAKRAIDIVVSAALLVICSPLLALGAAAVKLSGPGPVLFRQPRLTEGNRSFEILKLRTMPYIENATSEQLAHRDDASSTLSILLRKTSIDELPQLINILRGDMSLIGPRPEAAVLARTAGTVVPGYLHRGRVRAGMTGLAQVHRLRGETSLLERARFDNLGIDRGGLWNDFAVVAPRTVGAVVDSLRHKEPVTLDRGQPGDPTPGSLQASINRGQRAASDSFVFSEGGQQSDGDDR